uniref:Uncharacterized protein n=1 Tax=Rhizophora mucronata TaxID=61149 RepID=A0A2P2IHS4_RHIMU
MFFDHLSYSPPHQTKFCETQTECRAQFFILEQVCCCFENQIRNVYEDAINPHSLISGVGMFAYSIEKSSTSGTLRIALKHRFWLGSLSSDGPISATRGTSLTSSIPDAKSPPVC